MAEADTADPAARCRLDTNRIPSTVSTKRLRTRRPSPIELGNLSLSLTCVEDSAVSQRLQHTFAIRLRPLPGFAPLRHASNPIPVWESAAPRSEPALAS